MLCALVSSSAERITFRHCSCIGTYTESEHQQSVKEIYMVVGLLRPFFISVKLWAHNIKSFRMYEIYERPLGNEFA